MPCHIGDSPLSFLPGSGFPATLVLSLARRGGLGPSSIFFRGALSVSSPFSAASRPATRVPSGAPSPGRARLSPPPVLAFPSSRADPRGRPAFNFLGGRGGRLMCLCAAAG